MENPEFPSFQGQQTKSFHQTCFLEQAQQRGILFRNRSVVIAVFLAKNNSQYESSRHLRPFSVDFSQVPTKVFCHCPMTGLQMTLSAGVNNFFVFMLVLWYTGILFRMGPSPGQRELGQSPDSSFPANDQIYIWQVYGDDLRDIIFEKITQYRQNSVLESGPRLSELTMLFVLHY